MDHGHADPFGYSYEKLALLFEIATARNARKEAQADLRFLRILRTAVVSIIDSKGLAHYKQVERALVEASNVDGKPDDMPRNQSNLVTRLLAAGVKDGGRK